MQHWTRRSTNDQQLPCDPTRPAWDTASAAGTGWQSLDLGLFETAWRMFESAKAAALEARSPMHYAHAMTEQAYVLMDLGMNGEAVECVAQAIKQYDANIPARLRAWMHGVHAGVCAASGAQREALISLELADAPVSTPHQPC